MKKHMLLFAAIFSLVWISNSTAASAQNLPKSFHRHEVPLDSARKFIKNLDKDAMQMKTKGGMFNRDIFEKLLAQKGCTGIRYYYAKLDDGTPTLVLVGVDSTGSDMISATSAVAEQSYPCPPYCATQTSSLTK
ncbi:MAG: hypothetical protein PHP42_05340 [Bacteroidota bacterium]|nr:hypothetical protein [Bacteroidota bacterium]